MQMQLAILVFLVAYILIATEKINRVAVALGGAAAMIFIGATDADAIFYDHDTGIDWNVIFLLLGMMIIVGVIHKTGLFEFLAIKAIKKAKGEPKRALVFLIILTAVASAILDNVTTMFWDSSMPDLAVGLAIGMLNANAAIKVWKSTEH